MKVTTLEFLAGLPEADLFEIKGPVDLLKFDRENVQDFLISLEMRKPSDFKERANLAWHEDLETWGKKGQKKIYVMYVVYTDTNGKPIFKSKPFRVHLKRHLKLPST